MLRTCLVVLFGLALSNSLAVAQTCTSSCSEREATCQGGAKGPAACAKAKAQCMKTGVWIGPNTGKSFPNTCKQ